MNDKIQCPNCGHNFDVEDALSSKLEEQFRKEFEDKIAKQSEHFNAERLKLEDEKKSLLLLKEKEEESILEKVKEKVAEEKLKIAKSTEETFQEKLKSLEDENAKRKEENKTLRVKEVELLKKEAELKEAAEGLKLEAEKEMLLRQEEIEEKARSKERESFELEKVKLLKQIDDNKKLAEEMKRKAEQGSMQMQGEVQELALEELLAKSYPFDSIDEVPKGVRGADSIQTVVNAAQNECGKIVYESKRTKSFSNGWIEKLKQDQAICKADIAVIVTETMPQDMDRFGERGGVWICTFQEVKSLSYVLREMLIRTNLAISAQDNKGDKMELLYNYLTGTEFVQTVERIVENYDGMLSQLNSEKKAMTKIWAQREKQIWVVQENIATLFGSIKGIAGNALGTSNVFELPDGEDKEVKGAE